MQEFGELTKNNADSGIIKSIQSANSTQIIDKIVSNEKKLKRKREVIESNVKSKKLPPLPSEFLELYQDDERKKFKKYSTTIPSPITSSIPQSHKNIEGNWATHVYMEVVIPDEFTELLRKIEKSVQNVILDDDIYSCIDEINEDLPFKNSKLHISLSRPIFLKYFQIDKFWDKLRKGFEDQKKFTLSFSGIEYLVNDAKTKSFLTLEVGKGIYELKKLLEHVNKVAKEFRQQEFYE
ncbi:8747_t:CDS:2 [Diversispora eburnea]|uniref:U6 snRNA phosphodiesterase 1 n=1 Tax=Diversispora eburnea TaxID=1213867 RepID=A0A9N9C8W9_9GLOM|nr:8747_t:CDS:2 [Diversispora eburnea]